MTTFAPKADRAKYFLLSAPAAKALSALSIGCVYAWFLLKFFVDETQPGLQFVVGLAALVGLVGCIVMFLCTYNFVANAPSGMLDERELAERNAAYMRSFQYTCLLLLVALFLSDRAARELEPLLSSHVVNNFLTLAFFTSLVMPATILAWKDKSVATD